MPKAKCAECRSAAGKLFTDPSDGRSYCHDCWVQFYGSAPGSGTGKAGGESSGGGMFSFTEVRKELGAAAAAEQQHVAEQAAAAEGVYSVTGSKKGGIPVSIEKRAKGKKVTVVSNVSGDADALLTALKKAVGCGGVVNPANKTVEIQGEKLDQVAAWLTKSKCMKGVSKQKLEENAPPSKKKGEAAAPPPKPAPIPELPSNTQSASIAIKKMKPADMKKILKARGLSTQGTKTELQSRLLQLHEEAHAST